MKPRADALTALGVRGLLGALCLLASAAPAAAQSPTPVMLHDAQLSAADADANDHFGSSVALLGNTAFVGAPGDDGVAADAGAVYVFSFVGGAWTQAQKLIANDGEAGDRFGASLSASGNQVVIGAPRGGLFGFDGGGAYVFRRAASGWIQVVKVFPTDSAVGDDFGADVSLDGSMCVVGAPGHGAGLHAGKAYVFTNPAPVWTLDAELVASDAIALERFGSSVAIRGDTVLVGADHDGPLGNQQGAAYVFGFDGVSLWSEDDKLIAPDAFAGEKFGSDVALGGGGDRDVAAVGARFGTQAAGGSPRPGEVHVYRREASWVHEAQLTASTPSDQAQFGAAVALDGDLLVVGAPNDDTDGDLDAGAAYVYRWTGESWIEERKLVMDSDGGEHFGASVSIRARDTLGGAPDEALQAPGDGRGSASVHRSVTAWQALGHALAGSAGEPLLYGQGLLQAGTSVQLTLKHAIAAQAAAGLIVGTTAINLPFKGGVLVPAPTLLVLGLPTVGGELSLASTWPGGIPAGFAVYFQYWIADAAGVKGFAASNAVVGVTKL